MVDHSMQSSASRNSRRWLFGLLVLLVIAGLCWKFWPASSSHNQAAEQKASAGHTGRSGMMRPGFGGSSGPIPVRVAAVNEQVFLVNASLGLYPDLLDDREAFKARFGRSRWVARWAGAVTLLRAQRQLRLHIELGDRVRDLRTLTLFVGNNRLQLEQLGVAAPVRGDSDTPEARLDERITAVVLKPIGTLAMLRLMLHGAMGTLGEAHSVERFEFRHLVVRPGFTGRRRGVKVAFDGEVTRMRAPLDFRVLDQPLYLMKPRPIDTATPAGQDADREVDR